MEIKNMYRLPKKFWNDHAERGLPAGELSSESGNLVWITATEDEIKEILSDAKFYSDPWGPDCLPDGLKASAARTVKAIERQLKRRKSLPHPFVKQAHCAACYRRWHTLYMRQWRVNKRGIDK